MSAIVINYSALGQLEKMAGSCADKAENYADALSRKVISKFDSIAGGASGNLNSAKYYIQKKVEALGKKADSFRDYSKQVQTLKETAKRVDGEVKSAIAQSQKDFLNAHSDLKQPGWKESIINFLVDLKNSNPLFKAIGNIVEAIGEGMSNIYDNIRYWYKCEGGKQIIKVSLAIAGAVVAVVALVAAWPALAAASTIWGAVVAFAGVIGSFIAVVNAVTNVVTSYLALEAFKNGDPAWSKIYDGRDTISDVFREHNFGSARVNNMANRVANTIDTIKTVCDIVKGINDLGKIASKVNCVKNFFSENGGLRGYMREAIWEPVKTTSPTGEVTTIMKMKVNDAGEVQMRYTFRSIFRGLRNFVTDSPVTNSGTGLRTELVNNFKLDFKDMTNTFRHPIQSLKDTWRHWKEGDRLTSILKGKSSSDANIIAKGENAWKSLKGDLNKYNLFSLNGKDFGAKMKDFSGKLQKLQKLWDKGYKTMDNILEKKPFSVKGITNTAIKNVMGEFAITQYGDSIGINKKIADSLGFKSDAFKGGLIEQGEKLSKNIKGMFSNRYGLAETWKVNVPEINIPKVTPVSIAVPVNSVPNIQFDSAMWARPAFTLAE